MALNNRKQGCWHSKTVERFMAALAAEGEVAARLVSTLRCWLSGSPDGPSYAGQIRLHDLSANRHYGVNRSDKIITAWV